MKDLFSFSGDKFLGIEFYDEDIYRLLLRFLINFIFAFIIIRVVYYPTTKKKEYVFTFALINTIVFFLCFMLKKIELNIGFALGLFAIFGILRYRTNTIPIKEMTYLFTAITLALINAISPIDWTMAFMNLSIIGFVYTMERLWFANKEQYKNVTYDRIELIENGQKDELIADLTSRTGLNVARYEIKSMNFLNDSAVLKIYFTQ